MLIKSKGFSLFLSFSLFFANSSMTAAAVATAQPAPAPVPALEDYESGKVRIAKLMANEETGIGAYNKKNLHYAETQNLTADLNIAEVAKFFGCKTLIGLSFMTETLKFPVTRQDKDSVLAARQQAIKALVENPELKAEVEQLITTAQEAEQDVVKLMSDFFIGKTCPEIPQLELMKEQNPSMYPFFDFLITNRTGKTISTALNTVGLAGCTVGTAYYVQQKSTLGAVYFSLLAALYSWATYKDYSTAYEKRSKMHGLNQLISVAEKLEKLCQKNGITTQFKISAIKNADDRALIQELKHDRYAHKDMYVFSLPAVHSFLYQVYKQEKNLAQVLAAIAELDVYNAIATKIIESQSNNNKVCFATFIDQAQPRVVARSFWNVLVKDVVVNSIDQNKHVILTGPNAGGKTTAIKAILQNIVLAQTFGVAAAESFELTMFDVIHSYLNISDDLINGLSLFASEVKRAQGILQRIKSLDANTKYFFALDELFTGTVAEDGEACAERFVDQITKYDGILLIYATHFDKLKQVGANNVRCENYKVDAPTKNADGKLVYPFTLSKGASDSRVAIDLAMAAGLFN